MLNGSIFYKNTITCHHKFCVVSQWLISISKYPFLVNIHFQITTDNTLQIYRKDFTCIYVFLRVFRVKDIFSAFCIGCPEVHLSTLLLDCKKMSQDPNLTYNQFNGF